MTKDLDKRKYHLIQQIMELDDEEAISRIEHQIETINQDSELWSSIIKPIRKSVTIDQMIEEQGYKPIEKEAFFEKVDELEIEESLEDLLAMLD